MTSLERTLVDVLVRPDLGGGWEEVWCSLESAEYFDLEQVTDYTLKLRSAAAVAKVGFFLEQHRDALMVEEFQLPLITHGRRRDESLASSAKNVAKRPLSDHCATVGF